MIWYLLGIVAVYTLIMFLIAVKQGRNDLQTISPHKKLSLLITQLNDFLFDGKGDVIYFNDTNFNLKGNHHKVMFLYSTDTLAINWSYNHLNKNVLFNVRNLSHEEQMQIAYEMIIEITNTYIEFAKETVNDNYSCLSMNLDDLIALNHLKK